MRFALVAVVLLAASIGGCRRGSITSTDAPVVASASASPSTSAPLSGSAAVPAGSHACADGPPNDARTCPSHPLALARARRFSAAHDWTCAIRAYDDAVRARPCDANARAERGYARLASGLDPTDDLDFARGLTRDPKLLSQVWFNLGLWHEQRREADAARISLAIAARLGNVVAASKLAAASRCTATWRASPDTAAPIARGWTQLAAARGPSLCDYLLPPPSEAAKSAAKARARACHGCGYGSATQSPDADRGDQCAGEGPWDVEDGYMHFHPFAFQIDPIGKDLYYFERRDDSSLPTMHRVQGGTLMVQTGGVERVRLHDRAGGAEITAQGHWSDEVSDADDTGGSSATSACTPDLRAEVDLARATGAQGGQPMVNVPRPTTRTYFDLASSRALLAIEAWDGDVDAKFDASGANITGADCSATITLGADR